MITIHMEWWGLVGIGLIFLFMLLFEIAFYFFSRRSEKKHLEQIKTLLDDWSRAWNEEHKEDK